MIFSYTFTDTLISNCISSRNIFTFPMNVVNPPLPLATDHSPRCFAHRATDLNRCRVIIRNFETSLFATRSKDPSVKSPRSTDEKMTFANQLFQNTSSASGARTHESLLRKHDTHRAVYLRITSARVIARVFQPTGGAIARRTNIVADRGDDATYLRQSKDSIVS